MTEHLAIGAVRPAAYVPRAKRPGAQQEPLPLVAPETKSAPFPVSSLGEVLAAAAGAIEDGVQCPAAIAAQSVLASAALAAQGHYDAEHPATGAAPCSLYLITLAGSGERKSTADKIATRAVERVQRLAQEPYLKARAAWHNECEAKKAARAKITSTSRKSNASWQELAEQLEKVGADPEPPLHPSHMIGDTNAEGLFKFALHGPGSMLWNNSEAGQVICGTGFTDENKVKTAAVLSRFWDGAAQDRLRAGDGAQFLLGRRLSLHLMVQPEVAGIVLADPILAAQGLFSRALICQPASRMGQRLFREAPADLEQRLAPYESRLEELLNRPPRSGERLNELLPHPLRWEADARHAWREFHDNVERSLGDGEALSEHRGFGAKIAENVARIATVLQVFNDEPAQCVTAETMLSAIAIGEYYLSETQRLRAMAEQTEEMRRAEEVRRLLTDPTRWPDTHVSVRSLIQYGPARARKKEAAARMIAILAEHGWLASEAEAAEIRGEKSRDAFKIWGRE